QPLVENAVRHGALRRSSGGEVTIRTAIAPDGADHAGRPGRPGRVLCVVEDNGPGVASRAERSGPEAGPLGSITRGRPGALGLSLVTRRLALSYAGAATFRLESGDGCTRSVVELPAGGAP